MGAMQKLGASNKFFYYVMTGNASFNIRLSLTINDLNLDMFKEAANEAIKRYPELGARTIIHQNTLISKVIDEKIVFVKEDNKIRHFGTDETNGYLFYFIENGNKVTISYYHGLSDVVGILEYLRCLMYLYATKTSFSLSEEELNELLPTIRCKDFCISDENEMEALDPYSMHGDSNVTEDYHFDNKGAYSLPNADYPDDADYLHEQLITLSTSEFIKKTKELGVSVVPLINDIVSTAIRNEYDTENMPVTAMVPVNLRPYVGSNTVVNCSDGIFIPYEKEDETLDITERCLKWKSFMNKQIATNNFIKLMGNKVSSVEAFEKDEMPIIEQAKIKTMVPKKGTVRPLTYALTYPGKMTLLSGLDRMLENFELRGLARSNSVVAHTFKDIMRIQVVTRTDDTKLTDCILNQLEKLNIVAKCVDCQRVYADKLIMEELLNE